ncbi:MAG: hypothetical protein HFI37_04340 [Lachnospiraceae bacterium]|nr:hypothetical protein [Lachnospiraceae bacterium]
MKERKEFITPVACAIFIALVAYFIMESATPALLERVEQFGGIFSFNEISENSQKLDFKWNFLYTVFDFSQGPFLADIVGAICMLLGGVLGRYLEKINSPHAGTGTEGNGKRFAWLVWAQLVGLAVANIFWRHIVGWNGWVPTFGTLISVTPVAIVFFGKPNFKKAITGIILGAIAPVWCIRMLVTYFSNPLNLPMFAGIGLAIGGCNLLAIELFRFLPWMNDGEEAELDEEVEKMPVAVEKERKRASWYVWTRVFGGDLSELYFWGSSLSGLGILAGGIISYFMNPNTNGMGILFPKLMFCFIFTSALSMLIWGPKWKKEGFAFTFQALLFVGALVTKYSTWALAIPICIIAAFVAPALMHWAMTTKFFARYHPCVTVQLLAGVLAIISGFILNMIA